uniref:Uncharacterized protein n=2 Tax=Anopheles albimanus TaxID=7167 RepID=A0A182FTI5_ANOAL
MDVSKFALDRSAYLNTAAASALYDSSKSQTNPYSSYLDPTSVLTKAYFDSKMYQDRAQAAANYAFDISKIYGSSAQQQHHQHQQQQQQQQQAAQQQQQQHHQQQQHQAHSHHQLHHQHQLNGGGGSSGNGSILDERESTPQLSDGTVDIKPQLGEALDGGSPLHGHSYGAAGLLGSGMATASGLYHQYSAAAAAAAASQVATAGTSGGGGGSSGAGGSSSAGADYRRPLTVIF